MDTELVATQNALVAYARPHGAAWFSLVSIIAAGILFGLDRLPWGSTGSHQFTQGAISLLLVLATLLLVASAARYFKRPRHFPYETLQLQIASIAGGYWALQTMTESGLSNIVALPNAQKSKLEEIADRFLMTRNLQNNPEMLEDNRLQVWVTATIGAVFLAMGFTVWRGLEVRPAGGGNWGVPVWTISIPPLATAVLLLRNRSRRRGSVGK